MTNPVRPSLSSRTRPRRAFGTPAAAVPLAWTSFFLTASARAAEDIPALRPPEDLMPPTFWQEHTFAILFAVAALLLGLAALAWWWFRPKPVPVPPPATISRQALESLRGQPEDFPLLSAVSRILRHYLAATLNWPAEELTSDELVHRLENQPLLEPALAGAWVDFFRRCDAQKFAPLPPAAPLGAVDHALTLLQEVELRRQAEEQAHAAAAAAAAATPAPTQAA